MTTWRGLEWRTILIAPKNQSRVNSRWTEPWEKFPPLVELESALSPIWHSHREKEKSLPVAMLANVIKCQEEHRLTPANCISVLWTCREKKKVLAKSGQQRNQKEKNSSQERWEIIPLWAWRTVTEERRLSLLGAGEEENNNKGEGITVLVGQTSLLRLGKGKKKKKRKDCIWDSELGLMDKNCCNAEWGKSLQFKCDRKGKLH